MHHSAQGCKGATRVSVPIVLPAGLGVLPPVVVASQMRSPGWGWPRALQARGCRTPWHRGFLFNMFHGMVQADFSGELGMSNHETNASGGSPRLIVAVMMALVGAMFFFVFLAEDIENMTNLEWADLPTGLVLRYIVAMGIGGAIAGFLLAGLFGRAGIGGWALAGIGGVLATLLAGLIGSAAGLLPDLLADGWQMADIIPIAFGLLVIPLAMVGKPLIALVWVALLGVTHVLAGRARRP